MDRKQGETEKEINKKKQKGKKEPLEKIIGEDDIRPNMEGDLCFTRPPRGSLLHPSDPFFERGKNRLESVDDSEEDNPFIKYDPVFPYKKNKRKGGDPDPDHFQPPKHDSAF